MLSEDEWSVNDAYWKFNELAPDSTFKFLSLSAILNEIVRLHADRTQLQEDFDENTGKKSAFRSILYDQLIKSDLSKLIGKLQSQLNPNNPHFETSRAEYRNFISSMNADSRIQVLGSKLEWLTRDLLWPIISLYLLYADATLRSQIYSSAFWRLWKKF